MMIFNTHNDAEMVSLRLFFLSISPSQRGKRLRLERGPGLVDIACDGRDENAQAW